MEDQQSRDDTFQKFTWRIDKFSRLNVKKLYSETVVMGGYPWRILVFPHGNSVDYLSIYLDAVNSTNLPEGWSRDVKYRLAVLNQLNSDRTITKETYHKFNAREQDWGFTSFMTLTELHDSSRGFLVEDTCIVVAEVSISKSKHENQAARLTASLISGGQAGHTGVEVPKPEGQGRDLGTLSKVSKLDSTKPAEHSDMVLFSASIGELMDFRGLGQIEKVFVPLLEEVCSQHPSLVGCQLKRSRRFTEWAFTALGRVLYFLNTRKVKDMNDLACKDLQLLWEELESFGFDLTWLEPHVQSALDMKNYVEMKRLKENVEFLELEMKKLEAKLANAKVDLDIARDRLISEGFVEIDLDAELGYGRP